MNDDYEVGYRDGENNRIADAQVFHEEVLGHDDPCGCPLAQFLEHVNPPAPQRPRRVPCEPGHHVSGPWCSRCGFWFVDGRWREGAP